LVGHCTKLLKEKNLFLFTAFAVQSLWRRSCLLWSTNWVCIMYRVIRNDCPCFNNLSYTIHLR